MKTLYYLLVTARPKQWIKNFSLFVAIFFSGTLLEVNKFTETFKGFLIFCLLSSAIYFLNDYVDREKDILHPGKKNRPLAAGKISPCTVIISYLLLAPSALILAYFLSNYFFIICLSYFLILSAYSLFFRNIIILDGMIIAGGFVLRVWAGALVSHTPISAWLIITTIATALLMSFGRRRCELTILKNQAAKHRNTLSLYPEKYLDVIITTATAFTLMSYSLFTFLNPENIQNPVLLSFLPDFWASSKWLMATIPIVLYGVFRYLYLIYEKDTAASPEEAIFTDFPLFLAIFIWGVSSFFLIYVL